MSDDKIGTEYKTAFQTVWILVVVSAGLIGWDFYARTVPGATISELILGAARAHPVVPFLFGVLGGHFFFPQIVKE